MRNVTCDCERDQQIHNFSIAMDLRGKIDSNPKLVISKTAQLFLTYGRLQHREVQLAITQQAMRRAVSYPVTYKITQLDEKFFGDRRPVLRKVFFNSLFQEPLQSKVKLLQFLCGQRFMSLENFDYRRLNRKLGRITSHVLTLVLLKKVGEDKVKSNTIFLSILIFQISPMTGWSLMAFGSKANLTLTSFPTCCTILNTN